MELSKGAVEGMLQLVPHVDVVRISYGNPVPVVGAKVLVEATEVAVNPTWDESGEDRVRPAGRLAPIARAGGRA